jgi:hypothetical protein
MTMTVVTVDGDVVVDTLGSVVVLGSVEELGSQNCSEEEGRFSEEKGGDDGVIRGPLAPVVLCNAKRSHFTL